MKQVLEIARFTVKGRFTRPATILVAIGLVAALGVWYYETWLPPIPQQSTCSDSFRQWFWRSCGRDRKRSGEARRRAAAMGGNWNEFRRIL